MKKTIHKGDEVVVLCGDDKGKRGKVIRLAGDKSRLMVSGVAIRKKHLRKNNNNPDGAILERESFIHRSNVRLVASESETVTE